jgi:hypothetical protein
VVLVQWLGIYMRAELRRRLRRVGSLVNVAVPSCDVLLTAGIDWRRLSPAFLARGGRGDDLEILL